MRLLPLLVAGLAMTTSTSTVDAQCVGLGQGTPSSNALVFFVTNIATKGWFGNTLYGGGQNGLTGADNTCNYDATNGVGRTARVQSIGQQNLFKAILSNQLINAKDRFMAGDTTPITLATVDPNTDVMDSNGNCIAAHLSDLFDCSHITNGDYNTGLPDSTGAYFGALTRVWTGSNCAGQRWHLTGGSGGGPVIDQITIQQSYCSNTATANPTEVGWSANSATTGHIGAISETLVTGNDWIELGTYGCNNGLHLYCLQAPAPPTAAPTSNVHGDPQFTGLQGQSFQVHGMPDEFFNLITTPDMQLNSRFAYLASGTCNYNNTDCWTHPGTYVDQLGFMFPELRIKAVAGPHHRGMMVHINDVRMQVTEQVIEYTIGAHAGKHAHNITQGGKHAHNITQGQTVRVGLKKHDVLVVETDMFTVTATNSDMFFNFGVEMHSRSLLSAGAALHHIRDPSDVTRKYPEFPIHGFLGQTWKNARYPHGQLYAGTADDYMMLDSKLFSTKFQFNQYQH